MDIIDKTIEISELYDLYQELLTDKQREYFEAYYHDDYSITEISENFSVSRNAVHDQIKKTVIKLYDYELKLNLRSKNHDFKIVIKKMKETKDLNEILELILELEKVE